MTKKLLLPQAGQRSQSKQLDINPTKPAVQGNHSNSTPEHHHATEDSQHRSQQGKRLSSADSAQSHNDNWEKVENKCRLSKWIDEQQVFQYEDTLEIEDASPVDEDHASTSGSTTPSPPELPPRPIASHPPVTSAQQPTARQFLLQQIRDMAVLHAADVDPNPAGLPDPEASTASRQPATCTKNDLSQDRTEPSDTSDNTTSRQYVRDSDPVRPELQISAQLHPSELPSRPPPIPPKPKEFITAPVPQALPSPPASHPPATDTSTTPAPFRNFTSSCGAYTVTAQLLEWRAGKVWLAKSNGIKVAVPLSKFSGRDIEYILPETGRRHDERVSAANGQYAARILSDIGKGRAADLDAALKC